LHGFSTLRLYLLAKDGPRFNGPITNESHWLLKKTPQIFPKKMEKKFSFCPTFFHSVWMTEGLSFGCDAARGQSFIPQIAD
jgi:hypothetical protein